MYKSMPIHWAIACAIAGVSLVVVAIAVAKERYWGTAAVAGAPGAALLVAFAIDAAKVIA